LAINETKFDSSVNDNEIHLQGFEVVRKDRSVNGRSGGGVSMYLRIIINYQIRDDLRDDQLECVVIEISLLVRGINPQTLPQDIFRVSSRQSGL